MNIRALLLPGVCLLLASCAVDVDMDWGRGPPDALAAGWNGEPVCELLHEDRSQRALRCTFPPGVGHERHHHPPHFGYVLVGGRMQITDAEGTRTVDILDDTTWDSDGVEWHEVLNVGDTTSVYLIVEPKD